MSSFARTSHHLADQLADHLKSEMAVVENVLQGLGIRQRRSALRTALPFVAGAAVVGVGVAFLIPSTRTKIQARFAALFGAAREAEKRIEPIVEHAKGIANGEKAAVKSELERPRIVPTTHQS
jgi:hypothetical protein